MSFAGALGVVIFCVILKLTGIQYKWSKETLNFGKAEQFPRRMDWKYIESVKMASQPFSLGDGK